jgi:O-acetylhomoserine/O-acetylserine sulfhydrylase-like pyridoxal-dependent enzyme
MTSNMVNPSLFTGAMATNSGNAAVPLEITNLSLSGDGIVCPAWASGNASRLEVLQAEQTVTAGAGDR